jgi:2-amino-4-hydroxy-6-hydroxymethyldihydropteridine diphosphokinase
MTGMSPGGPNAAIAWVALGANIGHRGRALARLRAELENARLRVAAASPEILTRPVGMLEQQPFHNQVVRLEAAAPLHALAWMRACQAAESAAGRRPTVRWGPRRADADLLLLGDRGDVRVELPELRVPHPALPDRPFLWRLLAAVDPTLRHPDGWLFAEGPPAHQTAD